MSTSKRKGLHHVIYVFHRLLKHRRGRILVGATFFSLCILIAILTIYVTADTFPKHVTVNGVDVSEMTAEEAWRAITEDTNRLTVAIGDREEAVESGYKFEETDKLRGMIRKTTVNPLHLFRRGTEYTLPLTIQDGRTKTATILKQAFEGTAEPKDFTWDSVAFSIADQLEKDPSQRRFTFPGSEEAKKDIDPKAGDYIDVSIGQQTVTVYEDYEPILSSSMVSGYPELSPTPTGTYHILEKERDITLYPSQPDKDGSKAEPMQVSYWIQFTSDGLYGFHDASWRTQFGGTIYQTDGSHGCPNLPTAFAAQLYDAADIGMKVYIHE